MKVTLSYTQLTSNLGAPYILSVCIMFTASCTGIRNFTMPHTKPYFPAGLQSYTSLFCSIQFTWAWIWYDSNKPPSAWLKLCHSLYHPTLLHSPHLLFNYSQHREREGTMWEGRIPPPPSDELGHAGHSLLLHHLAWIGWSIYLTLCYKSIYIQRRNANWRWRAKPFHACWVFSIFPAFEVLKPEHR